MTIVPDTKDWTWVLDRPCPECGLDTSTLSRESIGENLRANAAAWVALLTAPEVRQRPAPDKWSPLEYACHVRDVFALYDYRLDLMLTVDDPLFPNWDQDATAVEQRYAEQDPAEVAPALLATAESLATAFDGLTGDQWTRPGRRGDGAEFTVDTFARYLIHDPIHHLFDATGLPASGSL